MSELAINKQSADALTDLSHKITSSTSNLRHETSDLKQSFTRERGALGEFADDAMNMVAKAEKAMEEYQSAISPIPNQLNAIADKINTILSHRMSF